MLMNRLSTLTALAVMLAWPAMAISENDLPQALERARFVAPEARQGVAVGRDRFYAIDNRRIAAYDRQSGRLLVQWTGDPERFTHLNSCAVAGSELVCAHSNYPNVPMESSIEWFDAVSLRHLRSHRLEPGIGSLTWIVPHEGAWWAAFANYDGKGGEPGRDHRLTTLVRYDTAFERRESWLFPTQVLSRFAPYSTSGGTWGSDGMLYVTGHDRPEVYVLSVSQDSSELSHVATIAVPTAGQAVAWDPWQDRTLWSIDRASGEVVMSQLPVVFSSKKCADDCDLCL